MIDELNETNEMITKVIDIKTNNMDKTVLEIMQELLEKEGSAADRLS